MPPEQHSSALVIRGARTHNLKNVDLTLPAGQLIVFTGVSGSGKSSLAFDTIYAEGQRRYVESLSAYARQFLERMEKPDVDRIDGICPSIAIRHGHRDPRLHAAALCACWPHHLPSVPPGSRPRNRGSRGEQAADAT
jgi:excinuclease ABC subunit A